MIVTNQVQNPMRQQQIQHGVKGTVVLDGHGLGRWCRDHHITQQVRAHVTVVPVVHRKGQHIGWPLHPAVVLVESSDQGIVDDRNTELHLSVTQGA
jgi:hypothetical protein